MTFGFGEKGFLTTKRQPFTSQKVAFYAPVYGYLQAEKPSFSSAKMAF